MSIKIPSGPKEAGPIDAAEDVGESTESIGQTTDTESVSSTATDPIGHIAQKVAAGEIGRDQAIELLLAQDLDSNMVKSAPKEALGELEEVLRSALDTDPQIKSLLSFLGPLDKD
jgi:hypothetical protein